jgi:magnesium transporter
MVDLNKLFNDIVHNIQAVMRRDTPLGQALWKELLALHPADIAQFFADIDREDLKELFLQLPHPLRLEVFHELSDTLKVYCLSFLGDQERIEVLRALFMDELSDLFDCLSDDELKKYLSLLHKEDREKVLSLLQFDPESAGGIMNTEVLTLMADSTVEKSIRLLQRLQPRQELHREIYVTDRTNTLVGHINLEDLVLKSPQAPISSILRKNELTAQAHEDREEIVKKMVHYN